MKAVPRVIFVNRFYWPDEPATAQLLTDLAESLAASGHSVSVITSSPKTRAVPKFEIHNGVEIVRVPGGPRFGHRNALLKALDFLSFAAGAFLKISRLLKPHDLLVVMTDPPLLGIPATGMARRRGAHVVHWIQDVYPEIAMAVGGASIARVFCSRRDHAWRNADACVVLGEDMAAFVRSRGVDPARIVTCANWAPAGLSSLPRSAAANLRATWKLDGKFVVMYSGNLGRVHDLDPVIAIAESLRAEQDVVFLFLGDGAQKPRLQSAAAKRGLSNIVFQSAQPRSRLGETLAIANLHLVTMREGCAQLVFPSKLYGIAAVGRPVLFIGPKQSELARSIEDHAFGHACSSDDTASAVAFILRLRASAESCTRMNEAAVDFAARNGGPAKAAATWNKLLAGLKSLAPRDNDPQK